MFIKNNLIKLIHKPTNIFYFISTVLLCFNFQKASAITLTYHGSTNKLLMILNYDHHNKTYLSKYRLVDQNNKILNKGQFYGCTYGGKINNIAEYLQKDMKLISVVPIKHGFAIHYVIGCGGQSIWQLDVITPACAVSVPATNDNGNYMDIGNDPNKILFGYLEGFGSARKVAKTYLTLDNENIIYHSTVQPHKNAYPKPKIICQYRNTKK